MSFIKIGKAAEYTGLHPQTLRNYVKQGKLSEYRNPANQRVFDTQELDTLITHKHAANAQPVIKAYYARSSENDKQHLNNQITQLKNHYGKPDHIIKDGGSGLNEKRKGLQKLIKLVKNNQINEVYITHKDRLTRFGYSYLEELFTEHNVKIITLDDKKLSPAEELMQDFMSLIASFSGKYYRLRSTENKIKLLDKAKKEVNNE